MLVGMIKLFTQELIQLRQLAPAQVIFTIAAMILAIAPLNWLITTWLDPSYASKGFYIFLAVSGLFIWSMTSPCHLDVVPDRRRALLLLLFTAVVRLIGQVVAVNTIGALVLVIDIYALGLLAGLKWRTRPLSPGWLAIGFAFSLPLERIAQRTIGFGLQQISAEGACMVLRGLYSDVRCEGVRIILAGKDVLIDLPCSGARTILLLLLGFTLMAAVVRPNTGQSIAGGVATLLAGLAANMVRISVLAISIAQPQVFFNIDLMARPWHDIVGLIALTLGTLPLLYWARTIPWSRLDISINARCRHFIPDRVRRDGWWLSPPVNPWRNKTGLKGALAFFILALTIVNLPRKAIDVAPRDITIDLPSYLAGFGARKLSLLPREKTYFTKYGGAAQKAVYGPNQLLVVRTSAPLRHLHAPDECLRGLGMKVTYLGVSHDPTPSAVYSLESATGTRYLVNVTFVSDQGHVTTNVAEAVWRWLQNPESTWSSVQRISPIGAGSRARNVFDRAVFAALEIPQDSPDAANALNTPNSIKK